MSGESSPARRAADVAALYAAHGTTVDRIHDTYCGIVVACLEWRGVSLRDHLVERRSPRSFLGWLDHIDDIRLTWSESESWHVITPGTVFPTHLDPLADPDAVAAWASDALSGRVAPATGAAHRWRSPTDPSTATEEQYLFEQRLAGFLTRADYAWARETLPPPPGPSR